MSEYGKCATCEGSLAWYDVVHTSKPWTCLECQRNARGYCAATIFSDVIGRGCNRKFKETVGRHGYCTAHAKREREDRARRSRTPSTGGG